MTENTQGYEKTSCGVFKIEKKNILFRDKHWIIRAGFRVSHRRSERKGNRLTGQNHSNNR
jgi:hypothetical protein